MSSGRPPHQPTADPQAQARMRMIVLPQIRWLLWPVSMAGVVLALGFSAKYIPGYTRGTVGGPGHQRPP